MDQHEFSYWISERAVLLVVAIMVWQVLEAIL